MGNAIRKHHQGRLEFSAYLDLETGAAAPVNDGDMNIWRMVCSVTYEIPSVIEAIANYKTAPDIVRDAISKPTDANLQLEAFQTLKPTVQQLRYFYEFAQKVEQIWPTLFAGLLNTASQPQIAAGGDLLQPVNPTDASCQARAQRFEMRKALFVELATLVEFAFYFDTFKMNTPAIQNDYSFYRRAVNRLRTLHSVDESQLNVFSEEVANAISLFFAQPAPITRLLVNATQKFIVSKGVEPVSESFATLIAASSALLENTAFRERMHNAPITMVRALRILTSCCVLYDQVNPAGIFAKRSRVDMIAVAKTLRVIEKHEQLAEVAKLCLNALRYSTKHYSDPTTSKQIKKIVG